jgi:hypothetical protein
VEKGRCCSLHWTRKAGNANHWPKLPTRKPVEPFRNRIVWEGLTIGTISAYKTLITRDDIQHSTRSEYLSSKAQVRALILRQSCLINRNSTYIAQVFRGSRFSCISCKVGDYCFMCQSSFKDLQIDHVWVLHQLPESRP